MEHRC
jgi:hypothetical protein